MIIRRACAAIAVSAFGLALGAGASFADNHGEVACDTPAMPAVYDWVVTQPAVAEQSHLEQEWARQTAPARTEWHWQRVTATITWQWRLWVPNTETPATQWSATSPGEGWVNTGESRIVEVTPAQTSTVVEYEFRRWNQQREEFFGDSRWDIDPRWNANDSNSRQEGWEPTGATRTVVLSPAVMETQYLWEEDLPEGEYTYTESVTQPGDGWQPLDEVGRETSTEDVWAVTEPEGEGWAKTGESRSVPPTYEYRWAAEWPGDGWTTTDTEPKKVIDVPAVTEVKEWVVVVPGTPAGEPCPVDEAPVEEAPVEEAPVDEPVEEAPVDEPGHQEPIEPEVVPFAPTGPPAAPRRPASAVPQVTAVSTARPTALAHTGTELTLLWAGLGLVAVGAGLGLGARTAARES